MNTKRQDGRGFSENLRSGTHPGGGVCLTGRKMTDNVPPKSPASPPLLSLAVDGVPQQSPHATAPCHTCPVLQPGLWTELCSPSG